MDFNERHAMPCCRVPEWFQRQLRRRQMGGSNDVCDYIESGSLTVSWNGEVSPCWPLLHTHGSFLHDKAHVSYRHIVGSVRERSLLDLWNDPAYVAYRERVQSFAFPPCTFCGGCDFGRQCG